MEIIGYRKSSPSSAPPDLARHKGNERIELSTRKCFLRPRQVLTSAMIQEITERQILKWDPIFPFEKRVPRNAGEDGETCAEIKQRIRCQLFGEENTSYS